MSGHEDGKSIIVKDITHGDTSRYKIRSFFTNDIHYKDAYVRSVQYPLAEDFSQAVVTFSDVKAAKFYSDRTVCFHGNVAFCRQISSSSQRATTTGATTGATRPSYSTVVSGIKASSPAARPGSAVPCTEPASTAFKKGSSHLISASKTQSINTGPNVGNSSTSHRGRLDTTTTGTHRQHAKPTEIAAGRSGGAQPQAENVYASWNLSDQGSLNQKKTDTHREHPKPTEIARSRHGGQPSHGSDTQPEAENVYASWNLSDQGSLNTHGQSPKPTEIAAGPSKGAQPEAENVYASWNLSDQGSLNQTRKPINMKMSPEAREGKPPHRPSPKNGDRRRGRHSCGSRRNDRSTGLNQTEELDPINTAQDDDFNEPRDPDGYTPSGSVDRESESQAELQSFPALQDDWPVFDNVAKAGESPRQSPEPALPPKETETRREHQRAWKAHEDDKLWYTSLTSSDTVADSSLLTDSSEERASERPSSIQLSGGKLCSSLNKTEQLEGHGKGLLTLVFSYPNDVQNSMSEHPGRIYTVEPFIAYLPYSHEGNRLMKLLKKAFESEKLFRVSEQPLSGKLKLDPIGVDLKTETVGKNGYPDNTYLDRLRAQLGQLGFSDPDPDAFAHAKNTEQRVHPPHPTVCTQPKGGKLLRSLEKRRDLQGFESKGTNILKFRFEAGKHEVRPGVFREYSAALFVAYLPNCEAGKRLANLLVDAFKDQKLFKFVDGNLEPRAVLKSKKSGPSGYPDDTYLSQLESQLKGLNIKTSVEQLGKALDALVLRDTAQAGKHPECTSTRVPTDKQSLLRGKDRVQTVRPLQSLTRVKIPCYAPRNLEDADFNPNTQVQTVLPFKNSKSCPDPIRSVKGHGNDRVVAKSSRSDDETVPSICTDYLRGACRNGTSCIKHHCPEIYQWQKCDSVTHSWVDAAQEENHQIEKSYCNPAEDHCQLTQEKVNFVTMTISGPGSSSTKIRRLCTPSTCEPSHRGNKYATCWTWYWLDKDNQWVSYGKTDTRGMQASFTSDDVETLFLKAPNGSLDFQTTEHKYRLDFTKLKQVNLNPKYKTERRVKRRPVLRVPERSGGSIPPSLSSKHVTKQDVCVAYLGGTCKNSMSCPQYHCQETFQWQEYNSATQSWVDMAQDENCSIEKSYCDPAMDNCIITDCRFNFTNMTSVRLGPLPLSSPVPIRRISTPSSCMPGIRRNTFATSWVWCWLSQNKQWISYGSKDARGMQASLGSDDIETQFLTNPTGCMKFKTEEHTYSIDFTKMTQKNMNPKYGTEREVRRRPAVSTTTYFQQSLHGVQPPSHWDITKISKTGYQLVQVSSNSSEYQTVNNLFTKTMPRHTIKRLQRIQNLELWDGYQRQKMWMERRLEEGKRLDSKILFHGTKFELIHDICTQGFDPRVSGSSSGTKYGQGSYFATNAKYSQSYSTGRKMLVAQVLTGDPTPGNRSYKRPPAKGPSSTDLYDSCVDNTRSPSIFVIFKQEQAYPEWLIEY